jgi:hypothetical protein
MQGNGTPWCQLFKFIQAKALWNCKILHSLLFSEDPQFPGLVLPLIQQL